MKVCLFLLLIFFNIGVFADETSDLIIQHDPYISRQKIVNLAQTLCEKNKTTSIVEGAHLAPWAFDKISAVYDLKIKDQKIATDSGGFSAVISFNNRTMGILKILQTKNSLSFNYVQNENDLEPISSIYFSPECESSGSYNTYFDTSHKAILRVKYNIKSEKLRLVKMKENILSTQSKTPENALPVGIIDSGVDYNHPALIEKMRPMTGVDLYSNDYLPFDYTNDVMNELSTQHYSHGTAVADLLSRNLNVRIIPVRVYSRVDLAGTGIEYLAQQRVRIINLSMGSWKKEDWTSYYTAAKQHPEILFIVAAGNESQNLDQDPAYPAAFDLENQIVVGSVNAQGKLSQFSNFGLGHVHVAAYGEKIKAATAGGGTWEPSGTSFAAPQVTHIAADLLIKSPSLSVQELKATILARAQKTKDSQDYFSAGVLTETLPALDLNDKKDCLGLNAFLCIDLTVTNSLNSF